jgi:MFS family permease
MFNKALQKIFQKGPVFWINLFGFWSNALYFYLGVVLPLYMSANGASLTEIGIMFSITQLAFLVVRLHFAAYSDARGPGAILLGSAALAVAEPAAYAISISQWSVGIGKIFSGISQSGYWAVNRSILYRRSKDGPAKSSSRMQIFMSYGEAAGRLLGGTVLQLTGFVSALWAAAAASMLYFVPALAIMKHEKVEKPQRVDWKRAMSFLNLGKYPAHTQELVKWQLVGMFADILMFTFLLPLYLASVGFTFLEIGGILALFAIVSGFASAAILRLGLLDERHRKMTLWVSCASLVFSAAFFFAGVGKFHASLAIMLLAIADGARRIVWEENLALSVKTTGLFDTDPNMAIAVFGVPITVAGFVTLLVAGTLADVLGYAGVFSIAIAANIAFLAKSKAV